MGHSPETLKDLCIQYCVNHLEDTLLECTYKPTDTVDGPNKEVKTSEDKMECDEEELICLPQFRTGVYLPEELSEFLFQRLLLHHGEKYIRVFHDNTSCKLRRINLSGIAFADNDAITKLFVHPVVELTLNDCEVQPEVLLSLKHCCRTLRKLRLAKTNLSDAGKTTNQAESPYNALSSLSDLQVLDLSQSSFGTSSLDIQALSVLRNLTWLDVSETKIRDISPLVTLKNTLAWLSLYDCRKLENSQALIATLKELEALAYLDISKGNYPTEYEYVDIADIVPPEVTSELLRAIASLPKLEYLDISGSFGLTGKDLDHFSSPRKVLKFLGLLRTGLCYHKKLPAEVVTGEANESQIFAALEIYALRPYYVLNSLRDLFNITSNGLCQNSVKAIQLVIVAMKNHKCDAGVQIAGSASLYHLSRGDLLSNKETRQTIVTTVLDAMESHTAVLQLQKNCCLTLCNFHIPDEVEFQYLRMTDILLRALGEQSDNYLRRIAITLFNAIVCHNSGDQKLAVGKRGSIQIIVKIIEEILDSPESDHLLETCWSSLWNVTDETPYNCRDFIQFGGMDLFVKCLQQFPDKPDIQRNMMGLLGNVAEVPWLRSSLRQGPYLEIFYKLLDIANYELEVCYNAGGVLAHLASDGEEEWSRDFSREKCMLRLMESVEIWDISSSRNINYRSFEPILRLLNYFDTPAVQRWATWALTNLTMVYPEKYCKLLVEEDGLKMLEEIKQRCSDPFTVDLATRTVDRVCSFLKDNE